jgi:tetratricopeptide (TPR) repeat protein
VQHAHQKAVIHRDLKPSNILVADVDGKPEPRIIDFGVAKATTHKLTERTMYTALGQLIGTPEYMSPEQADLTTEDVDTRTDVYSLGVILYELLAGALPLDSFELRRAGFEGIIKLLREKDPPRPSTRVSTLGERTAQVAQSRRTDSRRLASQLKGDLDWIVMRSLEKDRNRRYGSPRELSQDIRRHLDHEPVLAGPPSPVYRTNKFIRRHRVALALTALVFLAISGALVESNRQRMKVEAALAAAEEERTRAVREAEKAEQVSRFIQEMLGSNDPFDEDYSVTSDKEREFARRLLDRAAENVETRLADEPEVLADVQEVLGTTYTSLEYYDVARRHLEASLALRRELHGDLHPDVATSLHKLGELAEVSWLPYEEARSFLEEALEVRRTVLGERHPDVAMTLLFLGMVEANWSPESNSSASPGSLVRAEQLVREALEIRRETGDVLKGGIAGCLRELARINRLRCHHETAVSLLREALAARLSLVGPGHYIVSYDLYDLGTSLVQGGDPEAAEPFLRQAHTIRTELLDEGHATCRVSARRLAECLEEQHRFAAADSFYVEALGLYREHAPTSGETLGKIPVALARCRKARGDTSGAEAVIREALAWARDVHGERSPEAAKALVYVADDYDTALDEKLATHLEALSISRSVAMEPDWLAYQLRAAAHFLRLHASRGDDREDYEAAEKLYREASDVYHRRYGDDIPWSKAEALYRGWGLTILAQDRAEEAEPILRRALEAARGGSPEEARHRARARAESAYGACMTALGRFEEAESLLIGSYEVVRTGDEPTATTTDPGLRPTLERLIDLYRRQGDAERVRRFEEELAAIEKAP